MIKRFIDTFCWLGKKFIAPLVRRRKIELKNIEKILITRECCIGDVLMMTPMVASLKQALPQSKIFFMVGDWSKAVLEDNSDIEALVPYFSLRDFLKKPLFFFSRLRKERKKGYDLIIVGDVGISPIFTAWLMGARYRLGFDAFNRGFLLTHALPRSPEDDLAEKEGYLKLLSLIGIEPKMKEMKMEVAASLKEWAEEVYEKENLKEKKVIALLPGGGVNPGTVMPSKRWGEAKFAALANLILRELENVAFIILGGKEDRKIAEEVASEIKGQVVNLAGQTDLKQTAALLERSWLVIGNDCGPIHLAAAVGTPTLTIYGPTEGWRLAPTGEKHRYIQAKIDCAPCYRQILGSFRKCQKLDCMDSILVEEVFQTFKEQIRSLGESIFK